MLKRMAKWLVLGSLLPLAGMNAGCQAIAFPFLMWGQEPQRDVPAEYPYLANKRVAIVVRAGWEMRFEYENVEWEVADHVQLALENHVPEVSVVDPQKVVSFQRETRDWEEMDPAEIGKRFRADRVMEIDLTQYTTREPESPQLRRGYIAGVINVYNVDYPDSAPAYSQAMRTVYPPDGPGAWGTSDRGIRYATMEAFAEEVAAPFYDRKVKVD